jgi:formate hydrogenlyase transcriptional activator
VIERATILSNSSVLVLDAGFELDPPSGAAVSGEAVRPNDRLNREPESLDEVAKRHILSVLACTNGVIDGPTGAAKILGLHPNTLRSRMQKFGIIRKPS